MTKTSIQIDRKNKRVTITMPLQKPRPSKSTGKALFIATTGGVKTSEEFYASQPVRFTANVFLSQKAAETEQSSGDRRKTSAFDLKNRSRRPDLTDTSEIT